MVMCIGIDVGRNSVKVVTDREKICFKSVVGEWRERTLSTNSGSYEVEIDGEKYFIADLAEEESFFGRMMATESKVQPETKVLFLSALALATNGDDKVSVTTGVPINQINDAEKDSLMQLLSGKHQVKVGTKLVDLDIDKISIIPEGAGVFWDAVLDNSGYMFNAWLLKRKVRVVDIGSRTINYVTYHDNKFLDRESGTLNYGCFEYENYLEAHGDSFTAGNQFTRRVVGDLSRKWSSYNKEDTVLLAGGGSILLGDFLTSAFPDAIPVDEPLFANCRGFYKKSRSKYPGEKAKVV